MNTSDLAWMVLFITVSQSIEMFILIAVVKRINSRMDNIAPAGMNGGQMIAAAAFEFMKALEKDENAQVFVNFIKVSAAIAADEVKKGIGGIAADGGGLGLETLYKRYPELQLLRAGAALVGPIIESQAQKGRTTPNAPPGKKPGGLIYS